MQAENELDAAAQRLRSSERGVAVKAERSGKGPRGWPGRAWLRASGAERGPLARPEGAHGQGRTNPGGRLRPRQRRPCFLPGVSVGTIGTGCASDEVKLSVSVAVNPVMVTSTLDVPSS